MMPMSSPSNANGHYELPNAPSDSISHMAWCPTQDYLAAASWNGEVRVWEVQRAGDKFNAVPKMSLQHGAPVLSCCISNV